MCVIPFSSCSNKSVLQHTVEVLSLLSDDVETDDASPGENLKLRLKGIEEEEILPGFILCSPDNLCHSGRTFDAQVGTPDEPSCCRSKRQEGLHTKIRFKNVKKICYVHEILWYVKFLSYIPQSHYSYYSSGTMLEHLNDFHLGGLSSTRILKLLL